MAKNGIDIASYQGALNLDNITYDFVIIKATQGLSYVNPYCDTHFQEAKRRGKKLGVYHYADGNDPIAEAEYFVNNCRGYIREAIFMLDWEGEGVEYTDWALRFLKRVEEMIGYKPIIYMSEYVENAYNWSGVVQNNNGLMIAKYSDYEIDNNYDMGNAGPAPRVVHWPFYMMWQWTSKGRLNGYAGDLDCDIFYGDDAAWDAYAGVQAPASAPDPAPEPTTTTTTEAVPEPTTTTTTITEVPATTTTTTVSEVPAEPVPEPSFWVVLWSILIAIINRLRGVQ